VPFFNNSNFYFMKYCSKSLARTLIVMWGVLLVGFQLALANPFPVPVPPGPGEEGEGSRCCAYSLHFVNLYEESVIKKVRVSVMCDTKICCAETDEWTQTNNYPTSVEWNPGDGSPIPPGSAIDQEFLIFLDGTTSPHYLQVEWIDFNDKVVCRHTIEIYCSQDYDEDTDWTKFTQKTALDDPNLFVMAVREEEEDEDACDPEEGAYKIVQCSFGANITCQASPSTYLVTLTGPAGFDSFTWTTSGASIPSVANPTVTFTTPGSRSIFLFAVNTSTGDSCFTDQVINIPFFNPSFSTSPVPVLCSTKMKMETQGIGDPSTVSSISWSCPSVTGFPSSGNSITYDFMTPGTYAVTMKILDIYGCVHEVTQNVVITLTCSPKAKVKEYYLCKGCEGPRQIKVTLQNLSTGGKCPVTFTWDFGDGQTATTNESQITIDHYYLVQDCSKGQTFQLKLKMTDSSSPTPCNVTYTLPVVIEPCLADFDTIVCPDGQVKCLGNMYGSWELPSGVTLDEVDSGFPNSEGLRDMIQFNLPSSGTYTVKFTGHCSTGGRCTVEKKIIAVVHRCARNDAERKKVEFWAGGKEFRMKYKLVQRQLPLIHNIKAKTKLKKKKKIAGIGFWKGTKADEIEASLSGTIYKCEDECRCKVPEPISGSTVKFNKTKAKHREDIGENFRSRKETLISTHRVVKSGHTEIQHIKLGKDDDPSKVKKCPN
jgi:hypothetical protein